MTVTISVAGALIGVTSGATYFSWTSLQAALLRQIEIARIEGTITHLDELLTSSARLSATTMDPAWEARYNDNVPHLDEAIKRLTELTPVKADKHSAEVTDKANQALVAMETRACELVRGGHAEEARGLLFGPEYLNQKQLYATGMESYTARARAYIEADIARHQRLHQLIFVVLGLALLGAGVLSLRTL